MKFFLFLMLIVSAHPAIAKETASISMPSSSKIPEFPCSFNQHVGCDGNDDKRAAPTNIRIAPAFEILAGNIFLISDKRVRIWGLLPPPKDDPHHELSELYLKSLIDDTVLACQHIESDADGTNVMRCLSDNIDLASMIIRMGMGTDNNAETGGYYAVDETDARNHRRGMWKSRR